MHKATFLEGTLRLTIQPDGPILIKAGDSGGSDPTLPDMEFVRTLRGGMPQVYIPGPSLKGVIRAHAERICRSLDSEEQQQSRQKRRSKLATDEPLVPLADNPLGNGTKYYGLDDVAYSSGRAIEDMKLSGPNKTEVIYRRSSFVSQIFGHTSLAGRVRFADAYSDDMKLEYIEERNGVAIDRIYGSVAVGPFNYETVVAGHFSTRIDFKNLTLAQLALLGLTLRDLAEGRIGIGFGKSRGLGRVKVTFDAMELYYPTCELVDGMLQLLNGQTIAQDKQLVGIGALVKEQPYQNYNFPDAALETVYLPNELHYTPDDFLGVRLKAEGDEQVRSIWRVCMPAWKQEIGL